MDTDMYINMIKDVNIDKDTVMIRSLASVTDRNWSTDINRTGIGTGQGTTYIHANLNVKVQCVRYIYIRFIFVLQYSLLIIFISLIPYFPSLICYGMMQRKPV
jgi:hypothetical protein